jgi:hypothetical protein
MTRSTQTQRVVPFTGEGAYHGSTKPLIGATAPPAPSAPSPIVDEMRPTTLDRYSSGQRIERFEATFPNRYELLAQLPVPSQEEIQDDGATFVWAPFEQAHAEAGPLTRRVLEAMRPHLTGLKRNVYIDSKIQFFEAGDVPVDSRHWHVDGTITARGPAVERLGFPLLHDMRARLEAPTRVPELISYQSSDHCATEFLTTPLTLPLDELIPNFDVLDEDVRALAPVATSQPAASLVRFDGLSLHRAVAARSAGWRLWVRCMETDREVNPNPRVRDCYGTVFRLSPPTASPLGTASGTERS